MIIITGLLLTYGAYELSGAFIDEKYKKYVAIVMASYPSVGLLFHSYGQLPATFSTALTTIALANFNKYLESNDKKDLILTALLISIAAYSHQLTVYLYFPIVGLAIIFSKYPEKDLKELFKRTIKLAIITLPIMTIPLIPYYTSLSLLTSQEIIPHGSRENIFTHFIFSIMFFWALWSFTITLLPNAFIIAYREKKTRPLLVAMLFYLIIGLGGATPIPSIIFGKYWEILTYERFTLIATILFTPFIAVMLGNIGGRFVKKYYLGIQNPKPEPKVRKILLGGFIIFHVISFIMAAGIIFSLNLHPQQRIPDQVLEDIAHLLDNESTYYYITLELKSQRIKLNLLTKAPTLDGGYNSARQDPIMAKSGVENIDASKHFPNGIRLLKIILSKAPEIGLKYVICADKFYEPILLDYGFKPITKYESSPEITVWKLDSVKTPPPQNQPALPEYYSYLWGIAPVTILTLTTILYIKWRMIDGRKDN